MTRLVSAFSIAAAVTVSLATGAEVVSFPLPNPTEIGHSAFAEKLNQFLIKRGFEKWQHDNSVRTTGPLEIKADGRLVHQGTHGTFGVKLYYSPEVIAWLSNGRKGAVADGGMIVKELYERRKDDPAQFQNEPAGYSVMVKDSRGSWDGWFYSDGGPLQKPTAKNAETFFDPNGGFGLSCINCHASADNTEGTFSSWRNIKGDPIVHETKFPRNIPEQLKQSADIHLPAMQNGIEVSANRGGHFWFGDRINQQPPRELPLTSFDHIVQGPRPDGHKRFVTSDQCMNCHDAVRFNSQQPHMALLDENTKTLVNLSPHSEWRYSMMGLSGRDPVFFAQLEHERALHPQLAEQIDNKCLSCHAVMGQRQFALEKGANALFTHGLLDATSENNVKNAHYAALGRDGVSCVICHQMSPDGLGERASFSGEFKLGDRTKIFGPYKEVASLPMENAMGLTPQNGEHIRSSALCGSCHTVAVPILDSDKKLSGDEFAKLIQNKDANNFAHEQTTYLEWRNSNFANGPQAQSCQSCHMPSSYKGKELSFKIANIEDETFPEVENRAADEKIRMKVRGGNGETYSRHSLQGINVFALELFNQHPQILGVPRFDNLFPGPDVASGFDTAIDSARELAQTQTARVKISEIKRTEKGLRAKVEVENLAGHKFPSGVGFRRAFIEFKVTAGDKIVWISGATDGQGIIGLERGGKFTPLETEWLKNNKFQPHHRVISRPDQVQIFEQVSENSAGALTTSFLSLSKCVKDNRLLPRGWKADGPFAQETQPIGVDEDPEFTEGTGKSSVVYDIALDGKIDQPLQVSATLYYQSLPPYFLEELAKNSEKEATQRLLYILDRLKLKGTAIEGWKLKIAQASTVVNRSLDK